MQELIKIENVDGELKVDSRIIAEKLGNDHKNVLEMIRKHSSRLETYGWVTFQTMPQKTAGGIQSVSVCFLNERQSTFLVTLSKNSEKAVDLKQKLTDSYFYYKEQQKPKIPANFSEALQLVADQAKKIEEDRPKVEFAEKVEISIDSISVAAFANLLTKGGYKIGQNNLFKWFYKNKYLIKSDRPYQKTLDNKWVEIEKIAYEDNGENERTCHKVLITGRGQVYFTNILKKTKAVELGQTEF